jgi:anti-anti-sigma factor
MTQLIDPAQPAQPALQSLAEIVTLPAEIDVTNSKAVGQRLRAAFRPGVRVVVADMRATEFCDTYAIRQLIFASNHAASIGAELRVVLHSHAVRVVLSILRADQVLRLHPNMQSALTGVLQAEER